MQTPDYCTLLVFRVQGLDIRSLQIILFHGGEARLGSLSMPVAEEKRRMGYTEASF